MAERCVVSREEAHDLLLKAGISEQEITPDAESWTCVLMDLIIRRMAQKMAEQLIKDVGCA